MKNKSLVSLVGVFALVLAIGAFINISSPVEIARAGTGDNVSGWAWSENIGWISFNCTTSGNPSNSPTNTCATKDYGVAINTTTGDFSGYAWSENIGWINFAPTGPAYFSDGDTANYHGAKLGTSGTVTGWARACAATANPNTTCDGNGISTVTGGWDGWIKLSGSWSNGVRLEQNQFKGYAWGSDVVGWVDFNPASYGGVILGGLPTGKPECSDSIDNDGDGLIDANDSGCYANPSDLSTYNPLDTSEYAPTLSTCNDWVDNDGDGYCDTTGGRCLDRSIPGDPSCLTVGDSEATGSVCNGVAITGAEVCDGTLLGGKGCTSFGYTAGTLKCSSDCKSFDTTLCTGAGCNHNGTCDKPGETIWNCAGDCFKIIEF